MVRQKTWSDVEVSAYLDGELDVATQSAFEAAMAQDQALRRQVDDLRKVIAAMRAVPLREPPRNYLLTPSMIAATPPKRAKRRRTPLFLMRLATSMAAATFVVTAGLGVISRGVSPAMVTQDKAESQMEFAVTQEVEKVAEAPAVDAVSPEKSVEAEKEMSPENKVAFEPLPPEAPVAGIVGEGIGGGGGGEQEAAPMMLEIEPASEDTAGDTAKETLDEVTSVGEAQPEEERIVTCAAERAENLLPASEPADIDAENRSLDVVVPVNEFPPSWLPGTLGILTLILAGITMWMSRRR